MMGAMVIMVVVMMMIQAERNAKKHQIVPYRESKLTRLFKTFFSGLGRASLIVCISQVEDIGDIGNIEDIENIGNIEDVEKIKPHRVYLAGPVPLRRVRPRAQVRLHRQQGDDPAG